MVLIWFVFFTNNDMAEDDGLSSIVNFEMPKLFKQEDEKLGFWSSRKASKQSESESLKSLRGEMLGKKKSLSSLEQEIRIKVESNKAHLITSPCWKSCML